MTSPGHLRAIPSVDKVLQSVGDTGLPRPVVVAVVRRELAALRREKELPDAAGILARVRTAMDRLKTQRLQAVINGTGIVIHTNLGRSPLGAAVQETIGLLASHYNNLEFDLEKGERGSRAAYLEHNLALLCGAGAAVAVNNCAAALLLVLRHFVVPPRREVIISRGELIQIGGGFRVPEILEASGATLREIGTTNRTALADYTKAIGKQTALILKVHRSNFFMDGFVASPAMEEIAALARRRRVPLVEDLGSGAVVPTETLGEIEHEPTPAEVLKSGVDLVCFSGDKLLGGPQAGLIAGATKHVGALKRDPFFRALRCDKLILGALQTTVDHYLRGHDHALETIPVLGMLRLPNDELRGRARKLIATLPNDSLSIRIGEGKAQVGGGSLPRAAIPSVTLDLKPQHGSLAEFAGRLRRGAPPVIGYVSGGAFKIDLRTVFPRQDEELARAIRAAIS